jgi:hypothetical protein
MPTTLNPIATNALVLVMVLNNWWMKKNTHQRKTKYYALAKNDSWFCNKDERNTPPRMARISGPKS